MDSHNGCLICERGASSQFKWTRDFRFSDSIEIDKGGSLMRLTTKFSLFALAAAAWTIVTYDSSASAQALVTGDLVLYYDFDSIASNQFLDGSGNGYNGDIHQEFAGTGSLTLETTNTARGGGAANFDQSTEALDDPVYIDGQGNQITDDGNVPSEAITLAVWVNLEETGGDQTIWQARSAGGAFQTHYQVQGDGKVRMTLREGGACCTDIVGQQRFKDGSESPTSLTADFDGDTDVDGNDFMVWQQGIGTPMAIKADGDANGDEIVDGVDLGIWGDEFGSAGDNSFDFGEWTHVAGTWDMATNTWVMYYNGVQIATGAAVEGKETELLGDWGDDVDITGDFFAAGTGAVMDSGGRRTQGLMDELYIYSRALTPSEIATLALIPQATASISAIPEPASIGLLAIASLALIARRKRKS